MYSVVHTGPKIQFGGLNDGFMSVLYHVGMDENVNKDPMSPADKQVTIESNNFFTVFLL